MPEVSTEAALRYLNMPFQHVTRIAAIRMGRTARPFNPPIVFADAVGADPGGSCWVRRPESPRRTREFGQGQP